PGHACHDGSCVCQAGLVPCNGDCVDPLNDAGNCGGCGKACPGNQACAGGSCACDAGEAFCDGLCTNTSTDPTNCGACGHGCGGGGVCEGGVCVCGPTFKCAPING